MKNAGKLPALMWTQHRLILVPGDTKGTCTCNLTKMTKKAQEIYDKKCGCEWNVYFVETTRLERDQVESKIPVVSCVVLCTAVDEVHCMKCWGGAKTTRFRRQKGRRLHVGWSGVRHADCRVRRELTWGPGRYHPRRHRLCAPDHTPAKTQYNNALINSLLIIYLQVALMCGLWCQQEGKAAVFSVSMVENGEQSVRTKTLLLEALLGGERGGFVLPSFCR